MPPPKKSPPKSGKAPKINIAGGVKSLSKSDPEVPEANAETTPNNLPTRNKRLRTQSGGWDQGDTLSDFKRDLLASMSEILGGYGSRLDSLESRMIAIQNQNTSLQSTNNDIIKSMNALTEDIKNIESKLTNLEKERKQLDIHIASVEQKFENLEIACFKTCMEIRNVPKVPREKKQELYNYIFNLSNYLGLNIQLHDLRDVYRLPSKKDATSSGIAFELVNTLTKTKFIDALKKHARDRSDQLSTTNLGPTLPKQPIYVSDLLTPKTKRLLFLAKDFAKNYNYEFVWPSNGRVCLRQAEGKPYVMVKSETHLNELKNNTEFKK